MKSHNLFTVFILFSILIYACNKESIEPPSNNVQKLKSTNSAELPFAKSNFAYAEIVLNDEDKEDEAINKKLYSLTKYLAEDVLNIELAKSLVAIGTKQRGKVDFSSFFVQNEKMRSKLEKKSFFGTKENPYTHKGVNYKSNLTIPNYKNVNNFDVFVIAIGNDIVDDVRNNNPDIIHGWAVNKNGILGEVKIGEKDAMASNVPVIIVTQNSFDKKKVNKASNTNSYLEKRPNVNKNPQYTNNKMEPLNYYFDQLRIDHRYERSKRSEVFVHSFRINEDGDPLAYNSFNDNKGKLLKDVHKNDVGDLLDIEVDLFNPGTFPSTDVEPLTENAGFIVMYERDWYANKTDIGTGCFNNRTVDFDQVKMKFDHEWYSFDPLEVDSGCNNSNNATIEESLYFFEVPSRTFDFEKGTLRLIYDEN